MKTTLVFISEAIGSRALIARHLSAIQERADDVRILALDRPNGILRPILKGLNIQHEILSSAKVSPNARRTMVSDSDYVLGFWDGRTMNEFLFEARLQNKPTKVVPVATTKVVNKDRGDDYDFYIGRGTPWGNPFMLGSGDGRYSREEAIDLFAEYFERDILTDPAKVRGLLGMRGFRLACHCKPLACHGDVIVDYLNSLDTDELPEPTGGINAIVRSKA